MVKEWRKVLTTKDKNRVFINIRKSELMFLGLKPDNLYYRTSIEKPNKIVIEFKEMKKRKKKR